MEGCNELWDWETFSKVVVDDPKKQVEFQKVTCDVLQRMKVVMPKEYYASLYDMYCIVYGCHFTKELAEKAVGKMVNVDGTSGGHWTYKEVEDLASKNGIKEIADLYYALNMLYSDSAKVLGSGTSTYLELAKALYFNDPDMVGGKLFKQWYATSGLC